MNKFSWLWAAWGGSFAVIEAVALHKGDEPGAPRSLSANLRRLFRTDKTSGRVIWMAACGILFGWLVRHIAASPVMDKLNISS